MVCSQEIKRHLLLGRIAITNLDSVLKSRDITLPTKVHIVKAMVFSVVMFVYGCKYWTIKKAVHQRIDAFELWCWRRSPGEGNSYPLQYSGLENSMDYTVHAVTKSQTRLSDFHFTGREEVNEKREEFVSNETIRINT